MRTDTELLDGVGDMVGGGACPAIINDDFGHWAVMFDGMQPCTSGPDGGEGWDSTFIATAETKWFDTIREALDHALDEWEASHE